MSKYAMVMFMSTHLVGLGHRGFLVDLVGLRRRGLLVDLVGLRRLGLLVDLVVQPMPQILSSFIHTGANKSTLWPP